MKPRLSDNKNIGEAEFVFFKTPANLFRQKILLSGNYESRNKKLRNDRSLRSFIIKACVQRHRLNHSLFKTTSH